MIGAIALLRDRYRFSEKKELDRSQEPEVFVKTKANKRQPVGELIPLLSRRITAKFQNELDRHIETWYWIRNRDTTVVVLESPSERVLGIGLAKRGRLDCMDEGVGIATAAARALDDM